eukprot:5074418-Alexandrium_andersonii.AAC.1
MCAQVVGSLDADTRTDVAIALLHELLAKAPCGTIDVESDPESSPAMDADFPPKPVSDPKNDPPKDIDTP